MQHILKTGGAELLEDSVEEELSALVNLFGGLWWRLLSYVVVAI